MLWRGVDEALIDRVLVNGLGRVVRGWGGLLRQLQSGSIRNYATWVLAGSLLVIFVLGVVRRWPMNSLAADPVPAAGWLLPVCFCCRAISKAAFPVALADYACYFRRFAWPDCAGHATNGAQFTSVVNLAWIDWPESADSFSSWASTALTFGCCCSRRCCFRSPSGSREGMIPERRKTFFALLLLFEFGLIGVFSALDLFVFYVFWEVALVPMYLMVGGWAAAARPAAVKFFVYTMLGSVLMLASIIYLHSQTGTFDYVEILNALAPAA